MDNGDDQRALAGRAIEDHMPRMLMAGQASFDLVGGAAHPRMIGQQAEDVLKLVRVFVGLADAELLGGVEVDFPQVSVCLPGELVRCRSGRPRALAVARASATISLTLRELVPMASASSR